MAAKYPLTGEYIGGTTTECGKAKRLAACIYRFDNRIKQFMEQDEETRRASNIAATDAFNKIVCHGQLQHIPEDRDFKDLPLPALGPHAEFDEDFMEPYNRLYHIYRYLYRMSLPSKRSIWLNGGQNTESPLRPMLVEPEWIPLYMRPYVINEEELARERLRDSQRLPRETFLYSWDPELDNELAKPVLAEVEIMLVRGGVLDRDPRLIERWEFMDSVRMQLHLHSHNLQLDRIYLTYTDPQGCPERLEIADQKWEEEIKPILRNGEDVVLELGVRLLGEDEVFSDRGPTDVHAVFKGIIWRDEKGHIFPVERPADAGELIRVEDLFGPPRAFYTPDPKPTGIPTEGETPGLKRKRHDSDVDIDEE